MEYYSDFKNTSGVLTNTANWEANKMMCQNSQSALIADTGLEKSCIVFAIIIPYFDWHNTKFCMAARCET